MACSSPFFLETVKDYRGRPVPLACRVCNTCRADRVSYWERRAKYEWNNSISSAFVTFTYDNDNVPIGRTGQQSLRRDDLHRYIDTLRHRLKKDKVLPARCIPDFSFIACGEYGDSFGRPHYHVLFFGLDFANCAKYLKTSWRNGSIKVDPVKNGAIRYVISYMSKELYGDRRDEEYFDWDIEAPFLMCSRGFGSGLFETQRNNIREYGAMKFGTKFFSVPPYWKNKFIDMDIEKADARYENARRVQFNNWSANGSHFGSPYKAQMQKIKIRAESLYHDMLMRGSKIGYKRPVYMYSGSGSKLVELIE
ncbi:replication initiation protein [Tortoise microvirus 65]|nr:replication initiation protein [Tortoise microvirus 65]